MSKYYESFQRLDRERDLLAPTRTPLIRLKQGKPRLKLGGAARMEVTRLVHRLFVTPQGMAPKVVLFAGINATSGCTFVAAHACDILAAKHAASVCLVDANFRAPSLHERFGVSNECGLADLVLDPRRSLDSVVRNVGNEGLWLLSSGSWVPNVEELTQSEQMTQRIAELRARFEYVVIDTSPASEYPDATALAGAADGVVLVIRADTTRRDTTLDVQAQFEAAHAQVLGAVLSQRSYPIPESIYARLSQVF